MKLRRASLKGSGDANPPDAQPAETSTTSPHASPPTIVELFPTDEHIPLHDNPQFSNATPRPISGLSARSVSPTSAAAPGRRRGASMGGMLSHPQRPNTLAATRERPSFQPSIRLRRAPSYQPLVPDAASVNEEEEEYARNRRRSSSEPQRPTFAADGSIAPAGRSPLVGGGQRRSGAGLQDIQEVPGVGQHVGMASTTNNTAQVGGRTVRLPPASSSGRSDTQYESSLVDMLDLLDPEVATLQSLTNVQNSLFVPNLGRFLNRTPTYTLTRRPSAMTMPDPNAPARVMTNEKRPQRPQSTPQVQASPLTRTNTASTLASVMSVPNEHYYAVLPHGVRLEGWSRQDVDELNDHVRHMLHSRRSKFKRGLKGFGQYVRKPLGFFITLYATLITLFGLAWVLFLIGWINVGGRKDYIVNVIDNVLVALFAVMGDGLIPWRIVDTYHMLHIAKYHHLSLKLRKKKQLPQLQDPNDLPALRPTESLSDLEDGLPAPKLNEYSVLSEEQQRKLIHHQKKFSRSHTFYKPHETSTHHAFPHRLLVTIVLLLDMHSCLQVSLGACTWAISYHHRPFALTTVILCCSITVNITAGILISIGDRRTRKKDVLEIMKTQELTQAALEKVQERREREAERQRELDYQVDGFVGHDAFGELETVPEIESGRNSGSDGGRVEKQTSKNTRNRLHKENTERSERSGKSDKAKLVDEKAPQEMPKVKLTDEKAQQQLREHHEKMGTAARKSMDQSRRSVDQRRSMDQSRPRPSQDVEGVRRDPEGVRRKDFAEGT